MRFNEMGNRKARVHFIYAKKMGEKYLKRYRKYFRDPDIREFDMQHEQWLFGGEQYTMPALASIDEFMEMPDPVHTDCCRIEYWFAESETKDRKWDIE